MSVIERGVHVAVGAADLAAEKVQELPLVKNLTERVEKLRSKSVVEQARELEPKIRKQADKLETRGTKALDKLQADVEKARKDFRANLKNLPEQARKQIQDLPETARKRVETLRADASKQVTEIRTRIEKRFSNGEADAPEAPKSKAAAKKETTAPAAS